ncbi:MAPEG family protein [Pseudomaricurvus sp. HS19]|uniref:MAPEG family protein n=1 Tax=Pseudomaricurvus sp. HS19 TaxID=2692626 RepID=UPI00136E7CCB|nr:MAPEG family protein [Pseudomaricurvus sp. HS19]MYM63166.1 MAPEG family protein [Pseudomaricurvus sp. HS19]
MPVSLVCVALLGTLTIALGFGVSMARARERRVYGYSEDPDNSLYQWVRAHGNSTEYVPVLMVLIYVLGQMPVAGWVVWCMVLVTFCRYLAALGLVLPKTMRKPNPLRFIGSLGTYVFGLALCAALLLQIL